MKYTFPSGSFYEGEMVDGEFYGMGTFIFSNGDVYKGEFAKDMFHGVGEYKYKSGSIYRGSFCNDMFQGIGTFMFADGTIEKGRFYQDKRVGKFFQKNDNVYYMIIYENDKPIKCIITEESTILSDKKPLW